MWFGNRNLLARITYHLYSYRIRPLTEKEEAVKVSKDVKKLREFEKTLLHNYELYLKELDILLSMYLLFMDIREDEQY